MTLIPPGGSPRAPIPRRHRLDQALELLCSPTKLSAGTPTLSPRPGCRRRFLVEVGEGASSYKSRAPAAVDVHDHVAQVGQRLERRPLAGLGATASARRGAPPPRGGSAPPTSGCARSRRMLGVMSESLHDSVPQTSRLRRPGAPSGAGPPRQSTDRGTAERGARPGARCRWQGRGPISSRRSCPAYHPTVRRRARPARAVAARSRATLPSHQDDDGVEPRRRGGPSPLVPPGLPVSSCPWGGLTTAN